MQNANGFFEKVTCIWKNRKFNYIAVVFVFIGVSGGVFVSSEFSGEELVAGELADGELVCKAFIAGKFCGSNCGNHV